ncbi:MAG: hypothetical protein VX669_17330 [Planctomycetota bacterium]|nr:hypothetical protein [Planctomycetota bacterium]
MNTRRAGNSVSLFPFLAVLVCAMGALIFLLLVVTRQIRAEVRAEARAEAIEIVDQDVRQAKEVDVVETPLEVPETPAPSPPDPTPTTGPEPDPPALVLEDIDAAEVDWSQMVESLVSRRREAEAALSRAETDGKVLETRLEKTRKELAGLQREDSALLSRKARLDSSLNRLRGQVKELGETVGRRRKEIRERENEVKPVESRFAFLPFDSANGTQRRPIFIECHPDRIEFASEKIDLDAGDLAGFTRRDNPLLAGVQALVAHWSTQDGNAVSDSDPEVESLKPYVLIVVRPGGIHAYYLARKYLSQLEVPIGYELVPGEMPLSWPVQDRSAAKACREAIALAASRNPGRGGNGTGTGNGTGRGTGTRGGIGTGRGTGTRGGNGTRRGTGTAGASGLTQAARLPLGVGVTNREGPAGRTSSGGELIPVPQGGPGHRRGVDRLAGKSPNAATGESQQGDTKGTAGRNAESQKDRVIGRGEPGNPGGGTVAERSETNQRKNTVATSEPGSGQRRQAPTFETLTVGPSSSRASRSRGGAGQAGDGAPRHWGVASLGATIGYERRVRVRIELDHITVAQQPRINTGVNGGELSAAEIQQRVIRAIQLTARSWGRPPERFYWVPAIRFEVSPGGFLYYERLNSLFRSWRISTSVDHVLPPATQPPIRLMQGLFEEAAP